MSVYLVVYVSGILVGQAGPLPYGLAECEARAGRMRARAERTYQLDSSEVRRMEFRCWAMDGPDPVGVDA